MTETATSPRHYQPHQASHSQHARSTTTPASNPDMAPFLSPRVASPPRRKAPSTPSPSYFGFQADESSYLNDHHAKSNWSPPSSTVRSTAALSPSVVPLDQSPEYQAFRKQSEGNKGFNLGGLNNFKMNMPGSSASLASRPSHGRADSRTSTPQPSARHNSAPKDIPTAAASHRTILDPSTAELSRSPKRMHSPGSQTESKRRASPPTFDNLQSDMSKGKLESPNKSFDGQGVRLQLPLDNMNASYNTQKARAETLPVTTDTDATVFATPQHVVNLLNTRNEDILLLDLRVQTQYANAHISSALNLCIPTTLLKRPSFNVQKLADTFKDEEQRAKFENWRKSSYIVVYDGNSAVLKDATICLNTIKKFRGEGYEGTLYVVRGGFHEFSRRFPKYVDSGVHSTSNCQGVDGDGPKVAPVVGGCPMPLTDQPANPFFGNIRQNMDLIGGVGQIELKHPSRETSSAEDEYPEWIKDVADQKDKGKKVANRFERIERREKKRMEDALSGKVSFGTPTKQDASDAVRIAGLEKGNKNRYNNIWPFEHSRVRLQGVPSHGCDYFNASHIKASWSNKRYISTQAPIPATFNDFWSVVWQQDVRVVVMLTAEKEGAQVKAHNYWDQKQYGPIHLDFLSEKRASLEPSRIRKAHQKRPSTVKRHSTKSENPGVPRATIDSKEEKNGTGEQPYVIVRKFTIRHDRFPFEPMREITQLQYSSWPDFGAPAHPAHLLGLVEQTNAVVRATGKTARSSEPDDRERPIMVHCSAGCGRTGTFCTVDTVIDMIQRQRISQCSRRHTSMDVDLKSPDNKHPRSDGERNDAMRRGSNGGFFPSQCQKSNGGVEGSWLTRGDVDLVEKTVEDFRHQRISMVQSLRQYVLCYEIVMEWIVEQRRVRKEEEHASTT